MKLILEAIKALFRKAEGMIQQNGSAIESAKEKAEIALAIAETAQVTADNAQASHASDAVIINLSGTWALDVGSYNDLKTKLEAGEIVKVSVIVRYGVNQYNYPVVRVKYDEENNEIEITALTNDGVCGFYITSNDVVSTSNTAKYGTFI